MKHAGSAGENRALNPRRFNLWVSRDGLYWQAVAGVLDNTSNVSTMAVSVFGVTLVRLDVSAGTQGTDRTAPHLRGRGHGHAHLQVQLLMAAPVGAARSD